MNEARANNMPNSSPRQGGYVAAPRIVTTLYDLDEIRERWGKDAETIYRAVALGVKRDDGRVVFLEPFGRPGHQKYYSEKQLVEAFGDPTWSNPPPVGSKFHKDRLGVRKGGNHQGFEAEQLRIPIAA